MRVGGGCGVPLTHMHMLAHACVVNMIISCKWPPHWGNQWEFPRMSYMCACVCMCMHVHMCVEHPPTTHTPIDPPPLGDPGISKIQ